jgi:hypothetical protein
MSPIVHVTFGMRGDGSLRAALKQAGHRDRVVRLWDDLSLGPIDPPEPKARWAWAKTELGLFPYSQYLFAKKNNAWDIALSSGVRLVAWVARRWAHEYCGFLEWLWRLGDEPCDIVDLHDVEFERRHRDGTVERNSVPCLAALSTEQILDRGLWDIARPLTSERRQNFRDLWRRLRDENTAFRVVRDGEFISAPITYYDDLLLSQASDRYLKLAMIAARAGRREPPAEVCDYVFHGRLHKLVQAGFLEAQGDIDQIGYGEVRLTERARGGRVEAWVR